MASWTFLVHTRPYIAFTVQLLSQFNKNPCQQHYDAALHVLKYIKGTNNQGLFFNKTSNFNIEAYCDSGWAACPITWRSISGFFILFGGSPISWESKKQVTVSLSSVDVEYRSIRRVCAELAWMSRLLHEFQVLNITPIPLMCDNMAAIYIATNLVFHEMTKHIELDCHFVKRKTSRTHLFISCSDKFTTCWYFYQESTIFIASRIFFQAACNSLPSSLRGEWEC